MIYWTFGLVAVFGVAVVFTLMQPPVSLKRQPTASGGRLPASIVEDTGTKEEQAMLRVMDLKVGCDAVTEQTLETNVHQVRVRGDVCLPKVQSISLINSANGFSATVFVPDPKRFATDYINLVVGENKLIVQLQLADGAVETREIKLTRENAISK
jgi:hypothetical protein